MNKKIKTEKEKIRRFPKFYVLDAVIFLLIVAIGLGIYFRYSIFDILGNSKEQTDATVGFVVKNIKSTTSYYIDIDDVVYLKDGGKKFGIIMASDENSDMALGNMLPAKATFIADGREISVSYPADTRIDAEGRINCKGIFSQDGSFLLNGTEHLSPGQTLAVCTEKVTLEITVVSIEKTNS